MMDYKDTFFEFDPFMRNIMILLQHISPRHVLRLTGQTHATLYADKDRLAQVMMNLITNAIKYSPDAHFVDVEVASEDDHVVIQVRDYGKGIPASYQGQIFERFYRISDADNACSGLGIGLYVSREIVARHRGKIWVESRPGQGSTFFVSLPIRDADCVG